MKKQPPSVQAIVAFLNGEPNSFRRVLGTYIGRALMLSLGYHFINKQENALKLGFTGSAIIEAYLLWYYSSQT